MSSLLFRHNISFSAVQQYLRGYQHELPIVPEEWGKAESLGLPIASLVLILEAVTTQPGEDEEDSFKVIELDIVVGVDSERPIVLSITGETYELTFLENVMTKRAQDARLTGWDFTYVIVEPARALSESKSQEIEQLGLSFARGGSRRERNSDGSGVIDPAISLLTSMGLELDPPAARKVMELGAFGRLVFQPVAPGTETPMRRVRESFRPVPAAGSDREVPPPEVSYEEISPALPATEPEASLPAESAAPVEAPGPTTAELAAYSDIKDQGQRFQEVVEEKKDDLQKLLGLGGIFSGESESPPQMSAESRASSAPNEGTSAGETARIRVVRPPGSGPGPTAQPIRPTAAMPPPVVPSRKQAEPAPPGEVKQPAADDSSATADSPVTPPYVETPATAKVEAAPPPAPGPWAAPAAGRSDAVKDSDTPRSLDTPKSTAKPEAPAPAAPSVPRAPAQPEAKPAAELDASFSREERPAATRPQSGSSAASPSTQRPTGTGKLSFQEAAGAQDPMGTLVARLEQQVDKATAKLSDQVEDLHNKLEEQLRKLVSAASGEEGKSEESVTATRADVCQQLNVVADDTEHKVADCAAQGRYEIKQSQEKGQAAIDEHQKSQLDALQKLCADLKRTSDELSEKARGDFKSLTESRGVELKSMVDAICDKMRDSTKGDVDRLKQRFDSLKERLVAESEAIVQSFGRHAKSLSEDFDAVCDRAREKLNAGRDQCELGIQQAATGYELDISRTVTTLLSTVLIVRLREHRDTLTETVSELQKRFSEEFSGLNSSQLTDISESSGSTKHAVSSLVADSAAKIESTWHQQRSDIEAIFEAASTYMEEAIGKAATLSHDTEAEAASQDNNSRELVEQWSSGADPSLLADKDAAIAALNNLKSKAQDNLARAVESRAQKLEEFTQNIQSSVVATKESQVQSVRETAEQAVQQVRDALQEAFQAIQATREHYLE